MKNILITLCCTILLLSNPAFAQKEQIQEIYTEGKGNNHFEAKIKAIDLAMRRAFLMLADKFVIEDENLKKIKHRELREIFNNYEARDEHTRIYPSGASYDGIIKFVFRQSKVNELIDRYATNDTKDKFFEALVIPVFKINNLLYLDDDRKIWISLWKKRRADLADNSLYYPVHDANFVNNIKPNNILRLSYDDFADFLPFKLYKKVIIPVAEYFTNRDNGNSFLKIKYIILESSEASKSIDITYDLDITKNNMANLIDKSINDFLTKYGRERKIYYTDKNNFDLKVNEDLIENRGIKKENYYTFLIEVNFDKEITQIQKKLNTIPEIKRFEVEAHNSLGYKLKIYADISEEELAEVLYYSGLSFYFNEYKNPVLLNMREDTYE